MPERIYGKLFEVKWLRAEGTHGILKNVGYVMANDQADVDAAYVHLAGYESRFLTEKVFRLYGQPERFESPEPPQLT